MNVLLFYPGGVLAGSLWRRWRVLPMAAVFLLLSVAIELCQYAFAIGTTETDDVIHNTLGAFLGLLATRQYEKHRRR
jgi:glycopeptide antibiotics resistance protein